ncbi:hypothetical protein KC921_00515 [Candidatus Woesebacteria bacterium]|nr:hypothetical protein [Candidatus Woesebacteria bacterium]
MNKEGRPPHTSIYSQRDWEGFLEGGYLFVRSTKITSADYETHHRIYAQSFPEQKLREVDDLDLFPSYFGLIGENPNKIFDQLLVGPSRERALVIGASGANMLLAMIAGYNNIDVIDLSEMQLGWCYAVLVFIALTETQDLVRIVEEFRKTVYFIRDYHSIQMPKIRQQYIDKLPELFSWFKIPANYHRMVEKNIEYIQFLVLEQLIDSNVDFVAQYSNLRNMVISGTLPQFILGNIFRHVQSKPGEYDTIVTSNVYEWNQRDMTLSEFCNQVTIGLKPGGVTNAHSIRGLDITDLYGRFSILRFEPCKEHQWNKNWLLIQKHA